MTNTDPAGFDPEATGQYAVPVLSLGEAMMQPVKPEPALPTAPAGPALVYVHSLGGRQTLIDRAAPGSLIDAGDDRLRELAIARSLLRHALYLVDRELNA